MTSPEAVRKHDGRVVAYDSARLAGSIARAAMAADAGLTAEAARRLSHELAEAVGSFLVTEGRPLPASADIRALTVKLLRQTSHEKIADAYAEHSRAASGLLWRIRVIEPGTPFTSPAGSPWDRRRLLESLRLSGIARDPAGEVAREVERRVVALNQERVSPALIHALTVMVLSQRAMDVKVYAARRVAFSMSMHVPRYDPIAAEQTPLPAAGAGLEAFWLQAVHSQEVVRAVKENLISLEPHPSRPLDYPLSVPHKIVASEGGDWASAVDPVLPQMAGAIREWCGHPGQVLWVRAEVPERAAELSRYLALLPESLIPESSSGAAINVLLAPGPSAPPLRSASFEGHRAPGGKARTIRRATPITINMAGLMIREALRDQTRATVRLAQTVAVVAQAHREREEYFNHSPIRGRQLPVAIAGLWNAVAWLLGESFDSRHISRNSRTLAATLISVVRGAVDTMRHETGLELSLIGSAPIEAARDLWSRDREFLKRDGVTLDAGAIYDGGPAVKIYQGYEDFSERVDFAKAAGSAFDEPPALIVEVPLGGESDAAVWRDCFAAFAQAGVPRLELIPGGGVRAMKNLARAVRSHLVGFPLFEQASQKE